MEVLVLILFLGITIYLVKKKPTDNSFIEEKNKNINTVSTEPIKDHISNENQNKKEEFDKEKIKNVTYDNYNLPSISLLDKKEVNDSSNSESIRQKIINITQILNEFDIDGKIVEVNIGPVFTQYQLEPKVGIKISKIQSIHRDLALRLGVKNVYITPLLEKGTIGIKIQNEEMTLVTLREVLEAVPKDNKLLSAIGKDVEGNPQFYEIDKAPHLLIAGSTGSGKSVCINSIIMSILMRNKPNEVKLVLIDPKKVELSGYNGIPHLLFPVITNQKKANLALQNVVNLIEERCILFKDSKTKNITDYNKYIDKQNENCSKDNKLKNMEYIIVIIDEFADLMIGANNEIEDFILKITDKGRIAGVYLIISTERPSTDIITGKIKSNITSRISFFVSSKVDSRTILEQSGAEELLGRGDMLFLSLGESNPIRIQGCFISDEEIKRVIDYVSKEQFSSYQDFLVDDKDAHKVEKVIEKEEYDDPLYSEIVEFAISINKISTSLIQRKFRLGYNRAAAIIDLLEQRGIIGPQKGSKPREVLVKSQDDIK